MKQCQIYFLWSSQIAKHSVYWAHWSQSFGKQENLGKRVHIAHRQVIDATCVQQMTLFGHSTWSGWRSVPPRGAAIAFAGNIFHNSDASYTCGNSRLMLVIEIRWMRERIRHDLAFTWMMNVRLELKPNYFSTRPATWTRKKNDAIGPEGK